MGGSPLGARPMGVRPLIGRPGDDIIVVVVSFSSVFDVFRSTKSSPPSSIDPSMSKKIFEVFH